MTRDVTIAEVFTTGMVADLLKIAPRTAGKIIDKHGLKGYRIPGSQDRRVIRADLVAFLRLKSLDYALEAMGEQVEAKS